MLFYHRYIWLNYLVNHFCLGDTLSFNCVQEGREYVTCGFCKSFCGYGELKFYQSGNLLRWCNNYITYRNMTLIHTGETSPRKLMKIHRKFILFTNHSFALCLYPSHSVWNLQWIWCVHMHALNCFTNPAKNNLPYQRLRCVSWLGILSFNWNRKEIFAKWISLSLAKKGT